MSLLFVGENEVLDTLALGGDLLSNALPSKLLDVVGEVVGGGVENRVPGGEKADLSGGNGGGGGNNSPLSAESPRGEREFPLEL